MDTLEVQLPILARQFVQDCLSRDTVSAAISGFITVAGAAVVTMGRPSIPRHVAIAALCALLWALSFVEELANLTSMADDYPTMSVYGATTAVACAMTVYYANEALSSC